MDGGVGKTSGTRTSEKTVKVTREIDIAVARHAGRSLAEQIGFSTVDKHCIITSISELASNIFFYAREGEIYMRRIVRADGTPGMEVVARDRGQGIEDLEFALQDGSSTQGGLGGGLPGVNRLMSEMEISSTVGQGTLVRAVKWLDEDPIRLMLSKTAKPTRIVTKD